MNVRRCGVCVSGLVAALVSVRVQAAETLVRTADELRQAATHAQPGDVISLATGEWQDVDLVIEAQGTAAAPITFAAELPGETIVTGQSRLRLAGEHLVVSGLAFHEAFHPDAVFEFRRDSKRLASHCRVTECRFSDCNPSEETKEDAKYVSIYGHDNRFDHCELNGKRTRGTTLVVWLADQNSGRHQLDHNLFGPRPVLNKNGGETIRIGDSNTSLLAAQCVVEFNLFDRCDGEAEIISNKSCANIYRHNTFRSCSGALTLRHGHRCTVESNWFLGEGARGTGGVRIIGEGHRVVNNYFDGLAGDDGRAAISLMTGLQDGPLNGYSPVAGAVVAYNTILDCKQSLLIGLSDDDVAASVPPRDCLIANNLIVGEKGPLVTLRGDASGVRWAGNLLFGAPTGLPDDASVLTADPRLSTAMRGVRSPATDGPAIGAADANAVEVASDIAGHKRPAQPDIGCEQRSTDPPQFYPLTDDFVGAGWTWH